MAKEQWQTLPDYRRKPLPDTNSTVASAAPDESSTGKRSTDYGQLASTSYCQPKDVSRYLKKTKENQKMYLDRNTSSKIKELQPGTKVQMQPLAYSTEKETSNGSETSSHSKVLCSSSRRWVRVLPQQTLATTSPSSGTWKFKCGTVSCCRVQKSLL